MKERNEAFAQLGTTDKPFIDWVEKYADQNYTLIVDDRILSRSLVITNFKDPRTAGEVAKITTLSERDEFRVFDNVVIATYTQTFDIQVQGVPFRKEAYSITSIFMKTNGKWQIIGEHFSTIKTE